MLPRGVGPLSQDPQSCILSVELREPHYTPTYIGAPFFIKATKDTSQSKLNKLGLKAQVVNYTFGKRCFVIRFIQMVKKVIAHTIMVHILK